MLCGSDVVGHPLFSVTVNLGSVTTFALAFGLSLQPFLNSGKRRRWLQTQTFLAAKPSAKPRS